MVQHVIAGDHGLINELEPHHATHAEEIHGRKKPVGLDRDDSSGHTEAHTLAPHMFLAIASATTACPSDTPPSPGGTLACRYTLQHGASSLTTPSARRAFWKQPPVRATGIRPYSRPIARTTSPV